MGSVREAALDQIEVVLDDISVAPAVAVEIARGADMPIGAGRSNDRRSDL